MTEFLAKIESMFDELPVLGSRNSRGILLSSVEPKDAASLVLLDIKSPMFSGKGPPDHETYSSCLKFSRYVAFLATSIRIQDRKCRESRSHVAMNMHQTNEGSIDWPKIGNHRNEIDVYGLRSSIRIPTA